MLELSLRVSGFCAPSPEGDHQDDDEGVSALFMAGDLRDGGEATLETLRQPRLPREEEEAMKCRICGRDAAADLCAYHQAAKEKVQAAYALWVNAYGKMEWKKYLDSVKRNPQTGQWAKEIAESLGDK